MNKHYYNYCCGCKWENTNAHVCVSCSGEHYKPITEKDFGDGD